MSFFKDLLKAAIIGAAIATGVGVFAGVAMSAGIGSYFATQFAVQFVLGAVSYALADKPTTSLKDQILTTRNPIAPLQVIYGRTRVGGVIVYMESTDSNKYLHMVIAFAGHEVDGIEAIYFNEELVTLDGNDFGYSGKARIKFKLGTDDQTAFSDLITESNGQWTNNHRLRGRACAYVRLEFDRDVFPNGMPNISFVVRGKKVYDPRSGQTVWSANPALCLNDYLTNERFGLSADYAAEIDSSALIAAANACDQAIALAGGGTQPRYLANGTFYTSDAPADIITRLLTSMVGKVVRTGGKWRILAGIYYTPTLTFDENDLRGGIKVQTLLSRRESFNAVKGVFISKDDNYVKADFPSVISATAVAEDGEEVYRSIELPFTTDPVMAQRLAKIDLLKARQQITVTMPLKLSGLQASIGDIIQVNNTRLGWSNKLFEVVNLTMAYDEALGVDLMLREISTDVFAWETSEEQTYDPAPNTNLPNAFAVAPVTDLTLSTQTILSPDGTAQSGILITWTPPLNAFVERYEVQYIRGSSNFDWGLITDASTSTTDQGSIAASATGAADYGVITEATSSAEPQYNSVFVTTPYYFINGAVAGAEYAVRVRAINVMGVRSSWSTSNQVTYGDTTAPDAPSNLTASGGYRQITVSWINPSVSDFDYVEIFGNIVDNFSTSTRLAVLRGSMFVDAPLAINFTRFYWVRAVDRSGNISAETASVNATTEFVDSDSFSAEVMNLFSEAGAYGIEPVATLPLTGDFDGQIKFDTTNVKLWRWDATGGVWSDDIFSITSGSVDAASFAAGIEPVAIESSLPNPTGYTGPQVVFLTTDNKLYRYTGTAWVASVSTGDLSGTLGSNLFSNSIRPVEVVGALPSTGNFDGRVAVLTTDGKLYRYSSGAWTAAVPTTDLSGTVSSAQIAGLAASKITGTLSDAQLAEISAAKITGQLINAQLADIAAAKVTGQLSDSQLAAISAAKISGQLTDAQLADIDAAKISGQLSNAQLADIEAAKLIGFVVDAQISTISAEKMTGQLTDGQLAAISAAKVTGQITGTQISDNAISTPKIQAGAITTATLAAESITTAKIAAGAVTATELSAGSVTTAKIFAGAVTATELAAGSVTTAKISAGAITSNELASNSITSAKISAGAVTTATLAAGAITSEKIATDTITAANIAAGAIGASEIAAGSITTAKIAAGAVTATELSAGSVTTAKISAGAITSNELASNSITAGKIAAGAVTAGTIAADAVTANEIAANAITSSEISAGAITTAKIAAGAIDASTIAAGAVTAGKIAANAVTATEIAADSITSAKIATGAVTADAIAANSVTASALQADSVTAGKVAAGAISTTALQASIINSTHIQSSSIQGDRIAANTITGGLIAASGVITQVAQINDGLITNAKISNLAADRIVADKIDSRGLSIKDINGNIILAAGTGVLPVTSGKSLALPLSAWNLGAHSIQTVADGKVGSQVLRIVGSGGSYPNAVHFYPIDRTKTYRVRFWARPSSNCTGVLYFSLWQWINTTTTGPVNGGRSPYKPSGQSRAGHNGTYGTDAWGEYNYTWTNADWQTGVTLVIPEFLDNYSGGAGYWEIQDFVFEEVTEVVNAAATADWSSVTGAGKPADYANYTTNTNQLTDGAGLGTTATWSGVSGAGKPADYADVTANNVAAAVANQGAFATLSQITGGNIGTYIASAAIDTAYIKAAAIKTALIDNAAVNTLQIAGNAVTVPSTAIRTTRFNLSASWQVMLTVSLDTAAQPVFALCDILSYHVNEVTSGALDFQIKVNGVVKTSLINFTNHQILTVLDQAPPSGSYSVTLEAKTNDPNIGFYSSAYVETGTKIICIGAKR